MLGFGLVRINGAMTMRSRTLSSQTILLTYPYLPNLATGAMLTRHTLLSTNSTQTQAIIFF